MASIRETLPAALACAALVAAPLAAQDSLFRGRVYPVGYSPQSLVATDLDADGDLDLVVANEAGDSLSFLMSQGGGEFEPASDLPIGDAPVQVLAADLDGDGRDDLVTLHTTSAKLELRLNAGGGGLLPAFVIAAGGVLPREVAAGDFDEDGALDLVVANEESDTVSLLLGDGQGGLAPAATFPVDNVEPSWPAHPKGLAVADFDEDGSLDVITANYDFPSTHSLLLGRGDGSFDPAVNFEMAAEGIWGGMQVQAVDLNGDGHVDLSSMINGLTGSVRLGDGAGGFLAPQPPMALGDCGPTAFGDLDGDGDLDGIVPGKTVRVISGNGLGGSTGTQLYCAGSGAPFPWLGSCVALADLDADGDLDAAFVNESADDVGLLFNDGTGAFEQPLLIPFDAPSFLYDTQLTDLDDDGFLDAITLHAFGAPIRPFRGDGSGGFTPAATLSLLNASGQLVLGDLDGNAHEDLVVLTKVPTGPQAYFVEVRLADGSGGFSPSILTAVTGRPVSLAVGDVDGDHVLDVFIAKWDPNTLAVHLGDGTGGFGPPAEMLLGVPDTAGGVVVADMNADGLLDALVSFKSAPRTRIYHGDGLGGFVFAFEITGIGGLPEPIDLDGDGDLDLVGSAGSFARTALATGSGYLLGPSLIDYAGRPVVGDLDGDGDPDVALMTGESGVVACHLNDGAGGFTLQEAFLAGGRPVCAGIGDLDGDGFADIVAGCSNYGVSLPDRLSVLLNQSPSPWQGLGHALHGSQGAPTLVGAGTLQPHSPVTLTIDDAKPFGSAVLAIGTPPLLAPFKGGVFVPNPLVLIFGLPLNASGHFSGTGLWYSGLPSGASIYFQAWIADAAGPYGFSATNGLKGTTP